MKSAQAENWWVYIVECADGTLYTGCAKDLEQRILAHNQGSGAKYTKVRLPVKLKYQLEAPDRSVAQHLEAEIKKLSRQQKQELIAGESI